VEVYSRDFLPRLCLAVFLAHKRFRVVFGHKWFVQTTALKCAESGDVFLNDHAWREKGFEFLSELKMRKVVVVSIEEEGPLDYFEYRMQLVMRQTHLGIQNFDFWMAWGQRDYEGLQPFSSCKQIINLGTPRTSMWGEFGRKLFQNPALAAEGKSIENFILVASNFWRTNSISSLNFQQDLVERFGPAFHNLFEADMLNSVNNEEEKANIDNITQAIRTILESTDFNVIYRPYPSEKHVLITDKWILKHSRFKVNRQLFSLPLVLASNAVIHTGSSIGTEAAFSGTPSISLIDFGSEFGNTTELTSHAISYRPKSRSELLELLTLSKHTLNSNFEHLIKSSGSQQFFYDFVSFFRKNSATCHGVRLNSISSSKRRLIYDFVTKLRRGEMYKHDLNKRPHLGSKRVGNLVKAISETFGFSYENLEMTFIDRDTYLIERIKS